VALTPLSKIQDPEPGQPQQLLFSANGRRLLLRLLDGSAAAHPIPNSPRATVGRPRRFSPPVGERLVALGWDKGLWALTWHEAEGLRLFGPTGDSWRVAPPVGVRFVPPAAAAPMGPLQRAERPSGVALVFSDAVGTLFALRTSPRLLEMEGVALKVVAFAARPALCFVQDDAPDGGPLASYRRFVQEPNALSLPLPGPGALAAFYGSGVMAVRSRGERWQILAGALVPLLEIAPPAGGEVVGVARGAGKLEDATGLVVLEEDRRTLSLVGRRGSPQKLVTAPAEILQACAGPGLGDVAFLTVRGEVEVLSVRHGAAVLRLAPGSAPGVTLDGGSP
jgi:hypothetical protein